MNLVKLILIRISRQFLWFLIHENFNNVLDQSTGQSSINSINMISGNHVVEDAIDIIQKTEDKGKIYI